MIIQLAFEHDLSIGIKEARLAYGRIIHIIDLAFQFTGVVIGFPEFVLYVILVMALFGNLVALEEVIHQAFSVAAKIDPAALPVALFVYAVNSIAQVDLVAFVNAIFFLGKTQGHADRKKHYINDLSHHPELKFTGNFNI
jgi:hypothetical protein